MITRPGGRLLLAIAAGAILCFAAATVPQLSTSYALPGDAARALGTIIVDPSLRLTRDPATGFAHLAVSPEFYPPAFASLGFVTAAIAGKPLQVMLDSSNVTYRTQPPTGPGRCNVGTGAWAVDAGNFYFCVPTPAQDDFVWARVPVQTVW